MDFDQFIEQNDSSWKRLDELTAAARKSPANLAPHELDEFVLLYQRISGHLTRVQTTYRDDGLRNRLTRSVAEASAVLYGTPQSAGRSFIEFFSHTFPAAVHYNRRFILASTLFFFVPMFAVAAWLANSDAALEAAIPEAAREALIEEDFEEYYSSEASSAFATRVTLNNIRVSFLAFASGMTFGLGTIAVLVANGINVGFSLGAFASVGEQPKFWGLILPHGFLELTAVIMAGAAGLRLGWTLLVPGDRKRLKAIADEGRRAAVLVIGLILAFCVAGLIEGFVSGSALSTPIRVMIGLTTEIAFVGYLVVRGRYAASLGLTGRFGERIPDPLATPKPTVQGVLRRHDDPDERVATPSDSTL